LSFYSIHYYGSCGIERIETFWASNKLRDTKYSNYNNDCSKCKMENGCVGINYVQEYITDIKSRGDNKDLGIFQEAIYKRNLGNIIYFDNYAETLNGRVEGSKIKYTYEYDDLDNPIKLTK
jgi:hypothetical protein